MRRRGRKRCKNRSWNSLGNGIREGREKLAARARIVGLTKYARSNPKTNEPRFVPYPLSYSLPRWALQSSGGEITTLLVLPTTGKVRQIENVHFPQSTNRRDAQSHPRSTMERCCCCQGYFFVDDFEIIESYDYLVFFGSVIVSCANRASSWIPSFIFLFLPPSYALLRIYPYYFRSFFNF